jgi:tagatose 6-phosphate kinase
MRNGDWNCLPPSAHTHAIPHPDFSISPMILCIGTTPTVQRTLTFDRLTLDDVNRAVTVDEYASGKSVNVARVAALLGADVIATGFVGGDRGAFLKAQLTADGVPHAFQKVGPQTRLCTTVIDRAGGDPAGRTVTELVEPPAAVDLADWANLFRRCVRLIRKHQAAVVVLSGSQPPGADEAFFPDVIEYAVRHKAKVIVDTRGEPLRQALTSRGFTVKLNRAELADTVGRPLTTDADLKTAMREVTPQDGGQVVVTMGKDGAIAWDGERLWRIPTPAVAAVNPIGSGDAFAAGLAVAAERKLPPAEAYALASACGAANALHPRAGVVIPSVVNRLRPASAANATAATAG